MFHRLKEKNYKWVMKNVPNVNDISDLVGRNKDGELIESSLLFLLLCRTFKNQMKLTVDIVSDRSIRLRQKYIYKLLQTIGSLFLNKKKLIIEKKYDVPIDRPIVFAPNHGFVEDVISTILIAERSSYILFGSLPRYFNTFDGIAAYLNGTILANRKNKESRNASVKKAVSVLRRGGNLILFPEGVWNKTANKLTLDLWPGIFKIAKQSNAMVVPIAHLLSRNEIHSSRLKPIDINDYNDNELRRFISDLQTIINTELYLLLEKYAFTNRDELSKGESGAVYGERIIENRIKTVGKYYDYPMEISADYRPKDIIREVDVWKPIANIQPTKENILHYLYAKDRVAVLEREDYQHRI